MVVTVVTGRCGKPIGDAGFRWRTVGFGLRASFDALQFLEPGSLQDRADSTE
jgi:hypothetical protein